ncbi:hypothetical protein SAMN05421640_2944 [Ekhidna lutea]|uniref:Uncharacterized protein n=1 Tax=Ekhidna lutea TaxID=447679 RepID=A0A239L2T7_EKHLU|nr:hypothetical protein [Ekhidna lutea]SNT24916.1 hypothetical protein SAMN05421640_2944 [Ekhidna lutea]
MKFSAFLKVTIITFGLVILSYSGHSQDFSAGINVDKTDINPNAVLHLKSGEDGRARGLLIPSISTSQRTGMNLTAADNGLLVFDSDENAFYFWVNGTGWILTSNTDEQDLANVLGQGNNAGGLVIENVGEPVNPQDVATKNYVDSQTTPDEQDLELSGNTLTLTNDPTSVDLSPYLDNTDNQNLSSVLASGNDAGAITITNLPTPVNPADVATKGYVDSNIGITDVTSADILDGEIANEDINAGANIAWSKIDKTGANVSDFTNDLGFIDNNVNPATGDVSGNFATGLFVDLVGGTTAGDVATATGIVLGATALDTDASDDLTTADVGLAPNQLISLDGSGILPAVDGSALTNLSASAINTVTAPLDGDVLTWDNTNGRWDAGPGGSGLTLPFFASQADAGYLFDVSQTGAGGAGSFSVISTTNTSAALDVNTNADAGIGLRVNAFGNTSSSVTGEFNASGPQGTAGIFRINDGSNPFSVIEAVTVGMGDGILIDHSGTSGSGIFINMSNASVDPALEIINSNGPSIVTDGDLNVGGVIFGDGSGITNLPGSTDSTAIYSKMQSDSIHFEGELGFLDFELDTDSTFLRGLIDGNTSSISALNSVDSATIYSKVQSDSIYFEGELDADSLHFESKLLGFADSTAIFSKVQLDSIYFEGELDADSLHFESKLFGFADSTAIFSKVQLDSIYFEGELDADSLHFESKLFGFADSTAIFSKVQLDSIYFEGELDADSLHFESKLFGFADSTAIFSKVQLDSIYFEGELDADSLYFESKLFGFADSTAIFSKVQLDSIYFEGELDIDSAYFESRLVVTEPNTSSIIGGSGVSGTITGINNSIYGVDAGASLTTGQNNTFIGREAGNGSNASSNTLVGYRTGLTTTGGQNVFVGFNAGSANTGGANNVFIGSQSGLGNNTGNFNVLIGQNADVGAAGLQNAIAIGYNATVNLSNSLVLGGTGADAVNVGIGTTTPLVSLDVTATDALKLPVGLDGQRPSFTAAQMKGMIRFNDTQTLFEGYDGSAWIKLGFDLPFTASLGNAATLLDIAQTGTGAAGRFQVNNGTSSVPALEASSNGAPGSVAFKAVGNVTASAGEFVVDGSATALQVNNTATSTGALVSFQNINGTNTSNIVDINTIGTGSALNISHNATNGSGIRIDMNSSSANPAIEIVNSAGASLTTDGFVGIGTSSPASTLDVNGNANIQVDLNVTGNTSIGGDFVSAVTGPIAEGGNTASRIVTLSPGGAIDNLNGGVVGKEVILIATAGAAVTIRHNTGAPATKIMLNAAIDYVMNPNSTLHLVYVSNTIGWLEVGRGAQ